MPNCTYISLYQSFDRAPTTIYAILFVVNCNECLSAEFVKQEVPDLRSGGTAQFNPCACIRNTQMMMMTTMTTMVMTWEGNYDRASCAFYDRAVAVITDRTGNNGRGQLSEARADLVDGSSRCATNAEIPHFRYSPRPGRRRGSTQLTPVQTSKRVSSGLGLGQLVSQNGLAYITVVYRCIV